MIIRLNELLRNARLAVIRDALDAGATAGYVQLYTTNQPSVGGGAITDQILLGTLTLSTTSSSIASGVLTFNPISDDLTANNTGTIVWARLFDGDGAFVMDADCGDNESNAILKFNQTAVQQGGLIKITSGTLTEGNL